MSQPFRYQDAAGENIPSNTQIGRQLAWGQYGLVHSAWALGMEGKDYREEWGKEADLGTVAHKAIECLLHGREVPSYELEPAQRKKLDECLKAFKRWRRSSRVEVTGSEIECISEKFRFGTRLDHSVRIMGRRALLEIKSTKSLYESHLVQMAAQAQAWNEEFEGDPIEEFHLLRIGKEDASFHHHSWPSLNKYFEVFVHLRALYDLEKVCKLK